MWQVGIRALDDEVGIKVWCIVKPGFAVHLMVLFLALRALSCHFIHIKGYKGALLPAIVGHSKRLSSRVTKNLVHPSFGHFVYHS